MPPAAPESVLVSGSRAADGARHFMLLNLSGSYSGAGDLRSTAPVAGIDIRLRDGAPRSTPTSLRGAAIQRRDQDGAVTLCLERLDAYDLITLPAS